MNPLIGMLASVALCIIATTGDYFLKRASYHETPVWNRWFWVGLILFASTAFGWVYVMRHVKLGNIGVIYGASTVLMLFFIGRFLFNESFGAREVTGMVFAVAAIVLMGDGGSD